jgi:Reverse transcriptase (RNA-dependent DNA polymerase)
MWCLEKPSPNANMIGCSWTCAITHDAAGAITCYHAWQGFSQVPGVDFFETYAPITKMASMHILLAMAACHNSEIHQVDIKSAYLNGEFKEGEIIYMHLPPGIHLPDDKTLTLHLLNSSVDYARAAVGSEVLKCLDEATTNEML